MLEPGIDSTKANRLNLEITTYIVEATVLFQLGFQFEYFALGLLSGYFLCNVGPPNEILKVVKYLMDVQYSCQLFVPQDNYHYSFGLYSTPSFKTNMIITSILCLRQCQGYKQTSPLKQFSHTVTCSFNRENWYRVQL